MTDVITVKDLKEQLAQFPDDHIVMGIFKSRHGFAHTINVKVEQAIGQMEGKEPFNMNMVHLVVECTGD